MLNAFDFMLAFAFFSKLFPRESGTFNYKDYAPYTDSPIFLHVPPLFSKKISLSKCHIAVKQFLQTYRV